MTEADGTGQEVAISELDERYQRLRLPRPKLTTALAESIRRYGQLTPVVVCPREETLAVVDGFKRVAATRQLERDSVVVRSLPLTEQAAVAAVYGLNLGARGLVDLEEALVVRELLREQGLSQVEVGELLRRHKSWVSRRLMLVERLCDEVQDDVRVGVIPVSVAREVARLPRGNQPEVAACVHRHGLSSRDAARLVRLHEQTTGRSAQEALLDDPRAALEAALGSEARTTPHDPRLGQAANQLRRQALYVAEGLARVDRLLPLRAVAEWSDVERQLLGELLGRVGTAASHVGRQLDDVARALQGPVAARQRSDPEVAVA